MHSGDCFTCHGRPNFTGTLANGETVNLTIDAEHAKTNLHSRLGTCGVCHANFEGYPHPTTKQTACAKCHFNDQIEQGVSVNLPFQDTRSMVVALNNRCSTCHENKYIQSSNGSHAKILSSGNLSAPVCSDCHGSHDIQPVAQTDPSLGCVKCHAAAYNSLSTSVHGAAMVKKAPGDAPNCSTCHSSHTLEGPGNPDFRKNTVAVCLKCHQNETQMARYNLKADQFDSIVDNFHTMKVDVLERQDLNVTGDAPVCIDCHGSHSIRNAQDAGSSINPKNLLVTCLRCHYGQSGFVVAGRAHFSAASEAVKSADFLQRFFTYFIPANFVVLGLYILLDARKIWIERRKQPKQ